MMPGDSEPPTAEPGGVTLDALLRETSASDPDRIALVDPPNREGFTDGPPRRLNWRETDRAVEALAQRLLQLGLPAGTVIGLQLPNTVEAAVATLGVLRAGMIAAPMPLLWRRADAVAALGRVGARALITTSRVGSVDHGALAAEIAAELFSIRHVCCFGAAVGDGALPFDDLFETEAPTTPAVECPDSATSIAIVTFETRRDGVHAVARSHAELIAGARALLPDAPMTRPGAILTSCPPGSFAGLALGLVSWLVRRGTLVLHHPFDADRFAAQCRDHCVDTVVVPGPLLPRFAQAGLLSHDELRQVLALWRAPERLAASLYCRRDGVAIADVLAFGEAGLVAAPRGSDGRPAATLPVSTPGARLRATSSGTLALSGAMVPQRPFPPGSGLAGMPQSVGTAADGIDTGYGCRLDSDLGTMTVTGPPAGLIDVGGYRFAWRDLQTLIAGLAPEASFAALPDRQAGHRLAGAGASAAADTATRAALARLGVNALIADAFHAADEAA